MPKKNGGQTEVEQLKKENEELKKRVEELESLLNEGEAEEEEIQEIENPYTVTNRAISELVTPKDTMFYLSGNQISLIGSLTLRRAFSTPRSLSLVVRLRSDHRFS